MLEPFLSLKINILGTELDLLAILISIAIFALGILIARIVRKTVLHYIGLHLNLEARHALNRLVYYGIIGIATLIAINNLGIDLTGLLLAGGIFGIIIGFATQSLIANLISGLFLQLDKPMQIGDVVQLPDMNVTGVVTEITPFSTRIRLTDGTLARIPNDKVFTAQIRNLTKNIARRLEIKIGIAYKEDAARAIEIIKNNLQNMPLVLVEPAPNIFVDSLGDSSVNINIWVWVPWQKLFDVRMQLTEQIKRELDKAGIEIPFPQRVIWFGEHK